MTGGPVLLPCPIRLLAASDAILAKVTAPLSMVRVVPPPPTVMSPLSPSVTTPGTVRTVIGHGLPMLTDPRNVAPAPVETYRSSMMQSLKPVLILIDSYTVLVPPLRVSAPVVGPMTGISVDSNLVLAGGVVELEPDFDVLPHPDDERVVGAARPERAAATHQCQVLR